MEQVYSEDFVPDGVDPDDAEQIVISRLPMLDGFRSRKKVEYLAHRSLGFSTREALALAKASMRSLFKWRQEDPVFAHIETNRLKELQQTVGPEIVRLGFMRNMILILRKDSELFLRSMEVGVNGQPGGLEALTDREYKVYLAHSKNYGAADLLSLGKALEPETYKEAVAAGPVQIIIEGEVVESEEARRAAARQLLDQFTTTGRQALDAAEQEDASTDGDG